MLRSADPTEQKLTMDLERRVISSALETMETKHNDDYLNRVFEGVSQDFTNSIQSQSIFKNSKLRNCDGIEELLQLSQKMTLSELMDSTPAMSHPVANAKTLGAPPDLDRSPWASKRRRLQDESCAADYSDKSDVEMEETPNVQIVNSISAVGGCSFKTAREKRHEEHLKKTGHHSKDNQSTCYKAPFLTKKDNGGGGARGKFVAPFSKDSASGGAPVENSQSSVLSNRTLQLLANAQGEIPETLKLFDLALVEAVCSEILQDGVEVNWDDIAGQDTAKQLVQEMVVWPMMNPHLFKGARTPPRGLLLFGPPGTGKTLIGRAIASNIRATFFNISASSLTSKWIGEGEKMVRILFAVAEVLQPTVIFIDEIDSILSCRKSDGEHESSRRIKTELLIQMDGCNPNSTNSRILIVGATNRPQELDEAARRRMPKQLYIPLPCPEARRQLVLKLMSKIHYELDVQEFEKIVRNTEGYSGADMKNLIQEACQGPIRERFKDKGVDISKISEDELRAVNLRDFKHAAQAQKASIGEKEIEHYIQYNEQYGAKIAMEESDDENW
eukprot:g8031.t1